ncbi:MAG TPA: 2'-5' RNA ligase family protein [Chitinophagaceae bacterium]|nr:2'-5' RNA ligase family protein [Chitinophagaceae bacterium]
MQQGLIQTTPQSGDNFKGMNEYLLVIRPDDEVYNKVITEKQKFYDAYHQKVSDEARAHITVACFMAREEMEETLIRWIQRVSSQQKSFPVALNNYSGFPEHTIYLRVQDHQPFKQLATQLKVIDSYIRSNGYSPVKLINRPHMSIARRLSQDVYEKAMVDYSQKTFFELFTVRELVLLRRAHQYDTWKVINIFRLLPGENNLFNKKLTLCNLI